MTVKIYLRAIVSKEGNYLGLFDSNGKVGTNDLTTDVLPGATVIWKFDCCSGIKSITRIYFKEKQFHIFKTTPKKRLLCKGYKLHISKDIYQFSIPEDKEYKEAYAIECILCNGKELKVDPVIRVPPPGPLPRT
jgi:hypothetical protein